MGVARPEPVGVKDWERHDDWSTTSNVMVGVPSAETGVSMWEGILGTFLSTGGLASDVELSGVGGTTGASESASIPPLAGLGVLCNVGGTSEEKGKGPKTAHYAKARPHNLSRNHSPFSPSLGDIEPAASPPSVFSTSRCFLTKTALTSPTVNQQQQQQKEN